MRAGRTVRALAAAVGALLAGSVSFVASVKAWPEIVTPAWFVSLGWPLYDRIFFPHTPLLILLTASAGKIFGFSAATLRGLVALPMAAAGGLLVLGTRPRRPSGAMAGLFVTVPLFVLWTAYTEGPALWPEPALAPVFLAAALLLERFERSGSRRALGGGGLLLGTAILVKQTSAWVCLTALLWLCLASRRREGRAFLILAGSLALPYSLFAGLWGVAFRTWAHVRWTFLIPVFSRFGSDIGSFPGAADLHEAVALFLCVPAVILAVTATPGRHLRTPAPWLALGCLGMAWPRWGLLHLAGVSGIAALLSARTALVLAAVARSPRRIPPLRLLAFTGGAASLLTSGAVAALGAGPLLADRLGAPLLYWDDAETKALADDVARRVAPGGELLLFETPQNLYPMTRTLFPAGLYVNPSFWYCLNKDDLDARVVTALAARPGLPVLFREPPPSGNRLRATALYRFLVSNTEETRRLDSRTSWRVVRPPGR